MKYFLDTEFHDTLYSVTPISIGIVAEDGRELYMELQGWCYNANPDLRNETEKWLVANVLPHLGRAKWMRSDVAFKLLEFLSFDTSPSQFVAYWSAYDWVVLCQLIGGLPNLPPHIQPWIEDLAWLASPETIKALNIPNERPHHALYDARQLREQYHRVLLMNQAEHPRR